MNSCTYFTEGVEIERFDSKCMVFFAIEFTECM
jgi:hypothetical protein